jgi:hypothetical protein
VNQRRPRRGSRRGSGAARTVAAESFPGTLGRARRGASVTRLACSVGERQATSDMFARAIGVFKNRKKVGEGGRVGRRTSHRRGAVMPADNPSGVRDGLPAGQSS